MNDLKDIVVGNLPILIVSLLLVISIILNYNLSRKYRILSKFSATILSSGISLEYDTSQEVRIIKKQIRAYKIALLRRNKQDFTFKVLLLGVIIFIPVIILWQKYKLQNETNK